MKTVSELKEANVREKRVHKARLDDLEGKLREHSEQLIDKDALLQLKEDHIGRCNDNLRDHGEKNTELEQLLKKERSAHLSVQQTMQKQLEEERQKSSTIVADLERRLAEGEARAHCIGYKD